MSCRVQSLADIGSHGMVIDVECHLSNNLPNIVIVGLANKSVDEAKERVRSAMSSSKLQLPRKRITINLAPADIPKDSSSFDLAIAAAIMLAGGHAMRIFTDTEAVLGELGLDGTVRPIRGIIGKLLAGRRHGVTTFYIPVENVQQASLVPNITIIPVSKLSDIYSHLNNTVELARIETKAGALPATISQRDSHLTIQDVIGQPLAKRALQIAAAGGHNILLNGPPGTGKSMLAPPCPQFFPLCLPKRCWKLPICTA